MLKFEPKNPLFDIYPKDADTLDFIASVDVMGWPIFTITSLLCLLLVILI
jgi:hypothetical protein